MKVPCRSRVSVLAGALSLMVLLLTGCGQQTTPQIAGTTTPVPTHTVAPSPTATAGPDVHLQSTSFTLDAVTVSVTTPVLPGSITTSQAGFGDQLAQATSWNPYREFTVEAIPYGTKSPVENLPIAQPGEAATYQSDLKAYHVGQGATVGTGPAVSFFGSEVTSNAFLLTLKLDSVHSVPTLIVEWTTEAGQRIWLLSVAEELPAGTSTTDFSSVQSVLAALSNLKLTSNTLTNPTTLSPIATVQ